MLLSIASVQDPEQTALRVNTQAPRDWKGANQMKSSSGVAARSSAQRTFAVFWRVRAGSGIRNANLVAGVALIAIALSNSLWAQKKGASVDQIHSGSKLVAIAEVPVRDSAPSKGAVYVKGQQTGVLRAGNEITVTGEQTVSTLLGTQKWVSFTRSDNASPASGWVLAGDTGKTSNVFDEAR
jgi:hypothetical protein